VRLPALGGGRCRFHCASFFVRVSSSLRSLPQSRKCAEPRECYGGPAEAAGIRRGNIIISFNGIPIKESHELPAIVARTPVGERAKVTVIRDGRERTFAVTIGELPRPPPTTDRKDRREERWGLTVTNILPEIASRCRFEQGQEGVVVIAVERDSSAAGAGVSRLAM